MTQPEAHLTLARRVVHLCYCCDHADPVTSQFVDALGMRRTMSTPLEPSPGGVLGLHGEIVSRAIFVFDHRGPRVSPAIEIQEWASPTTTGTPSTDVFEAGIKAVGLAVGSPERSIERLVAAGAMVTANSSTMTTVVDAEGVTIELVEDGRLEGDHSVLRHLRFTVTDLERSVSWYQALGFTVVGRDPVTPGDVGSHAAGRGERVRMRLADEPFEFHLVGWHSPAAHGRHPSSANHRGIFRVALAVDSTDQAVERLAGAAIRPDRGPMTIELHDTPVPAMRIAFFTDPDGVAIELVERPRSAFR